MQEVAADFREISGISQGATVRIRFGEFTLDWESRQLVRGGIAVHLTPKALELLKILLESRPRAVSKNELHERLWPAVFVSDATLTSLVAELRAGINDRERPQRFLRTVHRFGYSFCGEAVDITRDSTSASGCCLIWDSGSAALRCGENILGRDRDVAAWFASIEVSRRHARIVVEDGMATIEDLHSKNGTYLGGRRLTGPHRLQDGDEIGLGAVIVRFRQLAAEPSTKTHTESKTKAR